VARERLRSLRWGAVKEQSCMKTHSAIAKIVSALTGVGVFVSGGPTSAGPTVSVKVSDNVMLLDLSPARIDAAAHLREVLSSLRSASVTRAPRDEVVKVAVADARSRG
jgi:hypothetical protein